MLTENGSEPDVLDRLFRVIDWNRDDTVSLPPTKAERWLEQALELLKPKDLASAATRMFAIRKDFIAKFGFAILDSHTVNKLHFAVGVDGHEILEIGAGTGYWGHELRRDGFDVISTDAGYDKGLWDAKYPPVQTLTALEALDVYGHDRTLMMVWPSYAEEWPTEALRAYQGHQVILVGEGPGGCVGADSLYDELKARWYEHKRIYHPTFEHVYDYIAVYRER